MLWTNKKAWMFVRSLFIQKTEYAFFFFTFMRKPIYECKRRNEIDAFESMILLIKIRGGKQEF